MNKIIVEKINHGKDKHRQKQLGCVYIIEDDNKRIKIGRSISPEKRIRNIQTQGGINIINIWVSPKCTNVSWVEVKLHNIFKSHRLIGEWFDVSYDIAVEKAHYLKYVDEWEVDNLENISEGVKSFWSKSGNDPAYCDNESSVDLVLFLQEICNDHESCCDEYSKSNLENASVVELDAIGENFKLKIIKHFMEMGATLEIWQTKNWHMIAKIKKQLYKNDDYPKSFKYYNPVTQTKTYCAHTVDNYLISTGFAIMTLVLKLFGKYRGAKLKLYRLLSKNKYFNKYEDWKFKKA